MKKKTIHDDEGLRLRVVIPISFDRSSPSSPDCSFKSSDGAWCEDDDNNNNCNDHYNYVDSEALEDSERTEEEKVAVEQLAELRRIRRLSSQEDTDDNSVATAPCATEGSFYTCEGPLPMPPLSHTCEGHCTTSPTASSSANYIFDFLKLKHMQGQQKQPPPQQQQDEQDKFHDNMMDMMATTRDYKALHHHHECSDFGKLPESQTRSLSDIYRDKSVLPSSPLNKKSKRRRKALSKIMEVGL